jgi:hypothetical protein
MVETLAEIQQENSTPPLFLPRSLDLFTLFKGFVQYWAGGDVECRGQILEDQREMPEELKIRWKGSLSGTLVIRCQSPFLQWLEEKRNSRLPRPGNGREFFCDMTVLYCIYLIQNFWVSELFELGLILPRPSSPRDWPAREPDATCRLLVDTHPLEIRFWAD